jgi:hypothetical protein
VNDGTGELNAWAVNRREVATEETIVNRGLWTIQVLLALFFALASGAPKLLLPPEAFPEMPIPLPSAFILFIGVAEVLGALGLVLPGLTQIRPGLTPLAAAGLTLITIGATGYWLLAGDALGNAAFAAGMTLILAFVAYGRSQIAPHRERQQTAVLQPAS